MSFRRQSFSKDLPLRTIGGVLTLAVVLTSCGSSTPSSQPKKNDPVAASRLVQACSAMKALPAYGLSGTATHSPVGSLTVRWVATSKGSAGTVTSDGGISLEAITLRNSTYLRAGKRFWSTEANNLPIRPKISQLADTWLAIPKAGRGNAFAERFVGLTGPDKVLAACAGRNSIVTSGGSATLRGTKTEIVEVSNPSLLSTLWLRVSGIPAIMKVVTTKGPVPGTFQFRAPVGSPVLRPDGSPLLVQ